MRKRQDTIATMIPCLCFLRMALTYIVPVRYCMNRGSANGAPAGGAFLVDIPTEAVAEVRGPDELRLLIFPQPLDGALKNQNAAPASPPCFRRRQTGCGTQHPLRLACVSLAAAPTTPRCFRRWRRSSSLQSAPLLFESCTVQPRLCKWSPAGRAFLVDIPEGWEPRAKQQPTGLIAYGTSCRRPVRVLYRPALT